MKILMPYVDIAGNDITSNVISGGTELFSRLVYKNFDVIVFPVKWETSIDENKKIVNQIKTVIENEKPDVILSNNIKSACFRSLRNLGVPMMHITHTNYGIITSNQMLSEAIECGHSIFGVSQSNVNWLCQKSIRLHEPELKYSGIISPAYCMYDLPVQLSPKNNVVTVGRANSYKAPFSIHARFEKSQFNPVVITSLGVDQDSIEYYEKNKHKTHFLNLNHGEIMSHLQNAVASVITCSKETFGITALESLSVGTPILIRPPKVGTHASAEIAASRDHYQLFTGSDIFEQLDKLLKVDRNEIKEMTQEKHSQKNWVKTLSNAFDKTIENYKKQAKVSYNSSLTDFFN